MEHKIGTRITLEVAERENGCHGCFFGDRNNCTIFENWECQGSFRKDHKDVIFKEIKEE